MLNDGHNNEEVKGQCHCDIIMLVVMVWTGDTGLGVDLETVVTVDLLSGWRRVRICRSETEEDYCFLSNTIRWDELNHTCEHVDHIMTRFLLHVKCFYYKLSDFIFSLITVLVVVDSQRLTVKSWPQLWSPTPPIWYIWTWVTTTWRIQQWSSCLLDWRVQTVDWRLWGQFTDWTCCSFSVNVDLKSLNLEFFIGWNI